MSETKKYGLILPNKTARNKVVINSKSVFEEDDDEGSKASVNQAVQKDAKKIFLKRQVQLEMEKAVADDPTVYEYDSIYDDLQSKKASVDMRLISKADRKPKYIGNLIKAAEDRKKEMERRMEKKIHKEREAEKGKYDDSESFVTDAYRKKMELMKREEEDERRKEQMEALMDVTKQSDLSGFYRNLLNQTTGIQPTTIKSEVDCHNSSAVGQDDDVKSHNDYTRVTPHEVSKVSKERLHKARSRRPSDEYRQAEFEPEVDKNIRPSSSSKDRIDNRKRKDEDTVIATPKVSNEGRSRDKDSSEKDSTSCIEEKLADYKRRRVDEKQTKANSDIQAKTSAAKSVNIVKRTTDNSLDDARVRYLARKTALRVQVVVDDSD